MKRIWLHGLLAALLITILALQAGAEDADVDDGAERFVGTFVYGNTPEHGRATIERAFRKALSTLNPITRRLAERRLKSSDPLIRSITIRRPAGKIAIKFVGEKTHEFISRPGVGEKVRAPNGNEVQLTQRFEGDALVQVFVGPKGQTNNRFTLSADGQGLTYHSVVSGTQLEEPITLRLSYKRQ